ncbi:sigma-70 family RNA polymerase sigma factor [Neobacillus kokaensis]|uniref:FliA/WhiG family RNA polymerase sigma factor n=1 Tax=Neobacillus kokaensis TaxID=2759023 RepID=A0ABQ3N8Q3_9BACI|nr:FliA/WhiG family RNA polymerase sigma factor [Neobacillus kokaensis]GHH99963.1 FliA/WhiG family RNA polymerase sigma factor [Neobacillus kokaensis]
MEWNVEEVIDQYIPLVHRVVSQMKRSLSSQADENDLISFGMTGLWDAGKRFDPTQGVKFETYAVQRIRGEILDGLRQTDHVSRTLRRKEKTYREAMETLEQSYLRRPTAKEVSEYMGVSMKEYGQTRMQLSFIHQDSLDQPKSQEENTAVQQIEDHQSIKQDEWLEAKEQKQILAELIDSLPEREKIILSLIYFENLSFTDVSKIFGLHKSRISQLHHQAIKRLRIAMAKHGDGSLASF